MNSIMLIICLLLSIVPAMSQNLKFENPTWDFGTIIEEGGEVSHTFTFTNTTSSPIVITKATTTCGCTTPQYSKKPIASGAESTIKITYDPLYRPGVFSREVKIYTSASPSPEVIKVMGDVTPRKKSIQEHYVYLLEGGVRISTLYGYLQNVSPLSPRSCAFEIINTSDKSRKVEVKAEFPSLYLGYSHPAKALEAGESGAITATYIINADNPFYGEITDELSIYIDGVKSRHTLQLRAYGVEDFSDDAKKRGARGQFSKKLITFESFNLTKGSEVKSFNIKNIGAETLFIRAVDTPKGVELTAQGKAVAGVAIPTGESLELNVVITPKGVELGDFVKYITFILNDFEQPVVRVKIIGNGEI